MLDLVLSLALLGAAEDASPKPTTAIECVATASPEEHAQGYKDWWLALFMGKDRRRRHSPPGSAEQQPPIGNTPAPGPLPLALLGMGVLGVSAAARSRRRKRKATSTSRSSAG